MTLCPHFSQARVLVVGDVMLDQYWTGDVARISPEAPVPVVSVAHLEERVGGAGNVALNVKAVGAQASLCGLIAEDTAGETLQRKLSEAGVLCHWLTHSNYPTITKLRVIARQQQLIRLDSEKKLSHFDDTVQEAISNQLDQYDVLVLSDYAKGMIEQPKRLIQLAKARGLKVLVDPKNPDLSVYQGATLITPNFSEFVAAVGPCHSEAAITEKAFRLIAEMGFEAVLVTRGARGMSLFIKGETIGYHIPAVAREVFDITGAGDTVIAVLAAALGSGLSLIESCKLGNFAAGVVVGKLGTATVSWDELQAELAAQDSFSSDERCLSEWQLLEQVKMAKSKGEKIVMTNGCFDILHAGHITYLEQARRLGARLIVAVNDDASVKRLKGSTRPVNILSHRMQLLAALRCVDWVVPFSEDTPQRLIEAVLPDVLVKGGDYTVPQIAGAQAVLANGGEVEILNFVDGLSTTQTLSKLKQLEQI
ncbi:MAG: bifunctional D-glycero-beta-D-manno-heptose-7-phosphate kinase/D-glycero-beta-D-manno-heptose 1-phosphate adenylyltransferase HldE [Gammaproteobacteria bacterium]|jgi:D-beta-D-heptose 7-phosphate kinase/D-beta-D-heptose 1-phosphate adenosyltransferase